jgi:hypothetical protein
MLLAGCDAAAHTAAAPLHGSAYVDVQLAMQADPLAGALAIEDRQIAALERTIAAAPAMPAPDARSNVRDASAAISRLASSSTSYALAEGTRSNAAAIPGGIARGYADQIERVHGRAQASQNAYASELSAQEQAQAQGLAQALNRRVAQAYALRAQSLAERESDAAVARDQAVSGRQAALRAKADAALPSQRAVLEQQLNDIAERLGAQAEADRRRDSATLASYAASLRASASADYASAAAHIRSSARANAHLRSRVTSVQLAAPAFLAMPFHARALSAELQRRADALKRYGTTGFARDAAQTQASLAAAASDLAARFRLLSQKHDAARTSALEELARLRTSRAALYGELTASILRQARSIAAARGLTLGRRRPAAVDLTPAVIKALKNRFNV